MRDGLPTDRVQSRLLSGLLAPGVCHEGGAEMSFKGDLYYSDYVKAKLLLSHIEDILHMSNLFAEGDMITDGNRTVITVTLKEAGP